MKDYQSDVVYWNLSYTDLIFRGDWSMCEFLDYTNHLHKSRVNHHHWSSFLKYHQTVFRI